MVDNRSNLKSFTCAYPRLTAHEYNCTMAAVLFAAHDRARGRLCRSSNSSRLIATSTNRPALGNARKKNTASARRESSKIRRACPKASGCSSTACRRSAYRTIRRVSSSVRTKASPKSTRKNISKPFALTKRFATKIIPAAGNRQRG